MGLAPPDGEEDYDLINAGKQPVTLLSGGCHFHHADSFATMRGGHLDICVLGAFQVSAQGDLANWHTEAPGAIPAVGGAMDLAIGAKRTFVMMEHLSKEGQEKLVAECSYPLTARRCVSRVYTDLAVIDLGPEAATVIDRCPRLDFSELQARIGILLRKADRPMIQLPREAPRLCRGGSRSLTFPDLGVAEGELPQRMYAGGDDDVELCELPAASSTMLRHWSVRVLGVPRWRLRPARSAHRVKCRSRFERPLFRMPPALPGDGYPAEVLRWRRPSWRLSGWPGDCGFPGEVPL